VTKPEDAGLVESISGNIHLRYTEGAGLMSNGLAIINLTMTWWDTTFMRRFGMMLILILAGFVTLSPHALPYLIMVTFLHFIGITLRSAFHPHQVNNNSEDSFLLREKKGQAHGRIRNSQGALFRLTCFLSLATVPHHPTPQRPFSHSRCP
jgi:hypothetical protein